MLKPCFIIPPSPFLLDERVFPSLGILKVAAALRAGGGPQDLRVLDLSGVADVTGALDSFLDPVREQAVCLTATSPQMPAARKIIEYIRACYPSMRIILGGPHPTLVNAAVKMEEKCGHADRAYRAMFTLTGLCDVVVAGDGEAAIFEALGDDPAQVIDADDRKSPFFQSRDAYAQSPFPARDLIDLRSYKYTIDGHLAVSLISQLGCPMSCGFCGGRNSPMLRTIRTRPVDKVVEEIETLYRTYGYTGFMCYDDSTEILTQGRGFVKFADLRSNDLVAVLVPGSGEMHFEKPRRIIKRPFRGELINIRSRFIDLAVTPDHRMWVSLPNSEYDHIVAREMIQTNRPVAFLQRAKWVGEPISHFEIPAYKVRYLGRRRGSPKVLDGVRRFPAKIWVQFMAWYLSEGCCYKPKLAKRDQHGYRVCIRQSVKVNLINVKEIHSVLRALGYHYGFSNDQFYIDSRELYEYLKKFGTSHYKYVPDEFKRMSSDLIGLFLDTYIKGDGHIAPGTQGAICSYSKRMRNDLQELAIKAGYWAYIDDKYKRVLLSKQRDAIVNESSGKRDAFSTVRYQGHVYCVSVSTGVVLVRRNGKTTWCGNCYDDELNVNRKTFEALMGQLVRLQFVLGVSFRLRGFIKAELFHRWQAASMYASGFRWILCGFESADERMLVNINKRATLEDNANVVRWAHQHGLKIKALMSIGHPGETLESVTAIGDWLIEQKVDDFDITIITPYPGSPYYDDAIPNRDGFYVYTQPKTGDRLYMRDVDFSTEAGYYKGVPGEYVSFVHTDHLTAEELVSLRDQVDARVRQALGLPFYSRPEQSQHDHSMGQGGMVKV